MTHYHLIVIILIDRTVGFFTTLEVIPIKIPIRSDKGDVKAFLEELKKILNMKDFDIDNNLLLVKSSKDEVQYTTAYTMVDLEYDSGDIVDRLKELTLQEYSETLIDKDDDKPPLLFVFGKDINNKQVYIKCKIKGETTKMVLCLSFHYAKYDMLFPYA